MQVVTGPKIIKKKCGRSHMNCARYTAQQIADKVSISKRTTLCAEDKEENCSLRSPFAYEPNTGACKYIEKAVENVSNI